MDFNSLHKIIENYEIIKIYSYHIVNTKNSKHHGTGNTQNKRNQDRNNY